MNIKTTLCLAVIAFGFAGCAKEEAASKAPVVSTEPAVQAEAARKEMNALPKTFQTPDYFKKNEPTAETASPK